MADQYTKTQLAMIAAPNFNDPSHYAGELQKAFLAINENFKKIASMPFVQGVQGDNYELDPRDIFDESSNALTTDGALLLNSIFQENLFSAGQVKSDCISTLEGNSKYYIISKTSEGEDKKVTPLECFRDGRAINKIYFYSVVNDEGVKTNSYLGQLYYFIDGRITEIGNVFGDNPTSLRGFTDYSGFYTYIPQNGNEAAHYEKTEILPTIYYDQERNDICWFLNGQQTGISAMGAKGEDGKDAAMTFVRVKYQPSSNASEQQTQGQVDALYNYGKFNHAITNSWDEDPDDIKEIKDGVALICIPTSNAQPGTPEFNPKFAFGIVKTEGNYKVAYWNSDTVIDNFLADEKIVDFFDRIGFHSTASSPTALAFPAYPTKLIVASSLIKHSLWSAWCNEDESKPQDLLFERVKAIKQSDGTFKYERDSDKYGKNVRLDNYDLVVQRFSHSGEITANNPLSNLTPNYSKITNDSIIVSVGKNSDDLDPNTEMKAYTRIRANSLSHIGGDIEVMGSTDLKNGATITKGLTVNNGATINNGATVNGGLVVNGGITSNGDTNIKGKLTVDESSINFKENVKIDAGKKIVGGTGGMWCEGSNKAPISNESYSADNTFYPIITAKASNSNAHYAIGTLADKLYVDYIPGSSISGNTNDGTKQLEINHTAFSKINKTISGMDDDGSTHTYHRTLKVDYDVIGKRLFGSVCVQNDDFAVADPFGDSFIPSGKVKKIWKSGIISGSGSEKRGWFVGDVPSGTFIVVTGGKSNNYFSCSNGWKHIYGGIYIVLVNDWNQRDLYLLSSPYYGGQGFIGKGDVWG